MDATAGGPIETLLKTGKRTLAADLRGYGETAPAVAPGGKSPVFGVEYKEAFLSLHLSRPLLGQRINDLLAVASQLPQDSDIELVGIGSAAPVVLHAALFDSRIKAVTIDGCVLSWDHVVRTPISHNQLANVVPGALAAYDLPDLASAVAPRKLTIRNPVDATGQPATAAAVEGTYRLVRAAYEKANAKDQFVIEK